MSNEAIYWGTGRRKNAVARVHIVPGTGKVTVNKRDAVEYFGRQQLVDMALMPLKVTETEGHFDVIALCDGGGISGQAGALRLGNARSSPSAKLYLQLLCTRGASPCVGLLFCFLLGSSTSKWRVLAP